MRYAFLLSLAVAAPVAGCAPFQTEVTPAVPTPPAAPPATPAVQIDTPPAVEVVPAIPAGWLREQLDNT